MEAGIVQQRCLWPEGGGSLGRFSWGSGGLDQKTSWSAKEPRGQKKRGEERGAGGDGGSVSLLVVLINGRGSWRGKWRRAGREGFQRGQEMALFGHHANWGLDGPM